MDYQLKMFTLEAFLHLGDNGFIQAAQEHACSECTQAYKRTAQKVPNSNAESVLAEPEGAFVKIVVLDGIVMGPTHCAFDNCTADLNNSRGGALCAEHEIQLGDKCHVCNCQNIRVNSTQTCEQHKGQWQKTCPEQ